MRRFWKLTDARVQRWLYLLTIGMWRGECGFTSYDSAGRITEISACSGGINSMKITITFYKES